MPNGHTVQYWPADMDPNIQLNIKNPIKGALNEDHYGHYTSYTTNHESKKSDEMKMVFKPTLSPVSTQVPTEVEEEIVSDIFGRQDTAPMLFPMNEANIKSAMRPKIVSIGTKLQSITPAKATNSWNNLNIQAKQKTQYEELQFKQKLPEVFVPPVGNYDEFLANCYRLSKEGSYAFSVPANEDLVKLASAISAGDIMKIKELASNLKMPDWNPTTSVFDSQRYTSVNNDDNNNNAEYFNVVNSSEAPNQISSTSAPLTSTKRAAYIAPRVRLRKKINRRPKIPERMLSQQQQQRKQARTTESVPVVTEVEIVTEANTIANSTGIPQNGNRRRYYEYDY